MSSTRRDDRKPFAAAVDVLVGGRTHWARARDVSEHGSCFECERKFGRGDAVQVDLSSFGLGVRNAVVRHARVEAERFVVGVEFFRPLLSAELSRLTLTPPRKGKPRG